MISFLGLDSGDIFSIGDSIGILYMGFYDCISSLDKLLGVKLEYNDNLESSIILVRDIGKLIYPVCRFNCIEGECYIFCIGWDSYDGVGDIFNIYMDVESLEDISVIELDVMIGGENVK